MLEQKILDRVAGRHYPVGVIPCIPATVDVQGGPLMLDKARDDPVRVCG